MTNSESQTERSGVRASESQGERTDRYSGRINEHVRARGSVASRHVKKKMIYHIVLLVVELPTANKINHLLFSTTGCVKQAGAERAHKTHNHARESEGERVRARTGTTWAVGTRRKG